MFVHILVYKCKYPRMCSRVCSCVRVRMRYTHSVHMSVYICSCVCWFTWVSLSARKASWNKAGVEPVHENRPRLTQNWFSGTNPKCRLCSRYWYACNHRGHRGRNPVSKKLLGRVHIFACVFVYTCEYRYAQNIHVSVCVSVCVCVLMYANIVCVYLRVCLLVDVWVYLYAQCTYILYRVAKTHRMP